MRGDGTGLDRWFAPWDGGRVVKRINRSEENKRKKISKDKIIKPLPIAVRFNPLLRYRLRSVRHSESIPNDKKLGKCRTAELVSYGSNEVIGV